MKFKITQISFGDGYAGSAKMAILSSKILSEKGHDVQLLVSNDSLTEKRANQNSINSVSLNSDLPFTQLVNNVKSQLEIDLPDFVITYHSLDRKVGIRLKKIFRKKIITVAYRQNMSKSLPIIGSFIYNRYYDFMIGCSRGVADDLVSSGIKMKKVRVLHNITEYPENLDKVDGTAIRSKLKMDDKFVLGISSWFHKERKGFDILFDAVSKTDDNFVLLIIGIPAENQFEVYEYAGTFGIAQEKIIMPGFVDDIYSYYKAMDIFILPSRSEGFSLALLEAAASGLPLLVSNIPGNNEFIKHNENGVLFDISEPGDILKRIKLISEDKNFAKKISEKSKKDAVEKYNLQNYGIKLENLLIDFYKLK